VNPYGKLAIMFIGYAAMVLLSVVINLYTEAVMRLWRHYFRCGRKMCCWCRKDLGREPGLPEGQINSSMCDRCFAEFNANDGVRPANLNGSHSRR
jgi:hypothetical protein